MKKRIGHLLSVLGAGVASMALLQCSSSSTGGSPDGGTTGAGGAATGAGTTGAKGKGCNEVGACAASASCRALSTCIGNCADQTCANNCVAQNPQGAAAIDPLLTCLQTNCATECQ